MSLYLYQAAYTPESLATQMRNPQDRLEAVRPAIEAHGGKLLGGGFAFGEYDVMVMCDMPSDTAMAAFALAVGAGGAVRNTRTTKLLSGQEYVEALRGASGSQYRPAR
ncbi:MAG: GYD domain-containing protein [Gammaproteobacteria bacterium]|nr:GYD domain-containing protein [Chloroflexota bacterium]MBV9620784.1 GYD domain-containing protein [Gammaproteobacteria bacterium]